ncbi:MAG: hypothetical protein IJ677_08030 [Alphaproteobacteria bacterium]|nr:hypothetical protein [Alphaproteobacteria bacterium]
MSNNVRSNSTVDEQAYLRFMEEVREAKDPTHKKGKKVLIDYCQNVLKYHLNPVRMSYAVKYLEENAPSSDVLAEFKDKINTEKFKKERAEAILRGGFIDLEDAVNYLKVKDENNPLLKELKVDDIEALKEERARDMAENRAKYRVNGRFDPHIHAADEYLDNLPKHIIEKPVEKIVEKEVEKLMFFDGQRIPPENSEAVEKNRAWIKSAYKEHFEAEEDGVPAWRKHNADVLDRLKFVDSENKENAEVRRKSETTIWEIAKNEVLRERSFDFSFMKLREADRLKLLRADLSDSMAKASLGVVGITPVLNRTVDGEITAEELTKIDAQLSVKALDKFLSDKNKDKADVKQDAVVGAALHESETMESFIGYVEKKGYSQNVVEGFKKDHKDFGNKMKSFWGKLWTNGKEWVANNRTRLVVDTAATAGMMYAFSASGATTLAGLAGMAGLGLSTAGVGYAAVAAYAVYAGLGALGWPIVEKRRKTIRQAKKEGRSYDDYKLGLKFNGLRKAWKDIRADEKEWKRYKNRAKTGAAAGVLIAGGAGALGTGLIIGMDAFAAKVCGTVVRSLSSVTSQFMNLKDTKNDLKLEDTAENRAAYNSAKWGMGIGLTIATLSSAWSIFNLLDSQNDVPASKGNVKGSEGEAQESAQKVAKKTAKVVKKVAEAEPQPASVAKVPTEWTGNDRVGQDVWADVHGGIDSHGNMRAGKVTGILSRTNAGFDKWNAAQIAKYGDAAKELLVVADAKVTVQDIYQNIANARAANPQLFGDMTDQEVFVSYVKLVEQTEKVMDGPMVEINGKMVKTLISRIDEDGLPLYNNEYVDGKLIDHNSNMKKLFMIIRCGKKTDISPEDVQAELSRIDLKSGRGIGEAFKHGVTNNVMEGEQGCQGVSIWRKIKNTFTKDPDIKPKPAPEPKPTDANVRSVQIRDLKQEDGNAQAVYTSSSVTLGSGTSDVHDFDLTDRVAQDGKKVGTSINLKGTGRKLEGAHWVNPKLNGGNGI